MNIFVLDKSPVQSAIYMCDKHIVKMIVESCQLLSTAHRVLDGTKVEAITNKNRKYTRRSKNCRRITRNERRNRPIIYYKMGIRK